MARESKSKRRRKRNRRQRNKIRQAERWAEWKATSRAFCRRRRLLGLVIGRNIRLTFDLDYATPIPMGALDPERPDESLKEIYDGVKEAEQVKEPKVKA